MYGTVLLIAFAVALFGLTIALHRFLKTHPNARLTVAFTNTEETLKADVEKLDEKIVTALHHAETEGMLIAGSVQRYFDKIIGAAKEEI